MEEAGPPGSMRLAREIQFRFMNLDMNMAPTSFHFFFCFLNKNTSLAKLNMLNFLLDCFMYLKNMQNQIVRESVCM